MSELLTAFVALIHYKYLQGFIFLIVVDDKGGIGKSLIAQIFAMLLRHDDKYYVKMIDTDYSNSTTAQTDRDTKMVDLTEKVAKGVLLNLLRLVMDKTIQHVVMDVGAREEKYVRALLPWLVEIIRRLGGRVVVARPITLGSHNQNSAARFMDIAEQLQLPVVFVRNEGQGRRPEYFDRWLSTETRAKAIERGAVEVALADANVFYADEAVAFGLSIAECALRDFSKLAEDDRQAAEAFFNEDVSAHLGEWLRGAITDFGAALAEAIAKCDARRAGLSAGSHDPSDAVVAPPAEPNASSKPKPRKG